MLTMSRSFLVLILAIAFSFTACQYLSQPTNSSPSGSGNLITGPTRQVAQQTVTPTGGTINVSMPGDSLDGLTLTVPNGGYADARSFTVSEAHINSHTFGSDFDPISPLITISNGGDYSSTPMLLRIPCHIAPGKFAMAFFYDPSTNTLEGMPLIEEDSAGITVATRHFESLTDANRAAPGGKQVPNNLTASEIVCTQIDSTLLEQKNSSEFEPGIDDLQDTNFGSYLAPNGQCEGQSQAEMWYYEHRKSGQGALYNKYNGGTPNFQWDDRLTMRLAGVLQSDRNSTDIAENQLILLQAKKGYITPGKMFYAFAYTIRLTHQPQLCIVGTAKFPGTNKPAFHAIVAYATEGISILVADPNEPGDDSRMIQLNFGSWIPYSFGGNGILQPSIPFEQVAYWGKTAFFKWHSISSRFSEFDAGTIGNGSYPNYTLKVLDTNDNYVVLHDGDQVDSVSNFLPSSSTSLKLRLWDATFKLVPGDGARFSLPLGKQKYGFEVQDTGGHWVDFQWLTLNVNAPAPSIGCQFSASQDGVPLSFGAGSNLISNSMILPHGVLNIGATWNEDPTNSFNYSSIYIQTKDSVTGPGTYDVWFGTSVTRYVLNQGHYYQSQYIFTDGTVTITQWSAHTVQGTFTFHASHSGQTTDPKILVTGSFSCTM